MPEPFAIQRCPQSLRKAALRVLHDGLPTDQQEALLHTFATISKEGESVFDGLFIAHHQEQILAALWVQPTPGNAAVLWQPALGHPAAPDLMKSSQDFLLENQFDLTQLVVHPDASIDRDLLGKFGFQRIAKLAYMTVESSHFPQTRPEGVLEFEPQACFQPERLEKVLLETYQDSLDCPSLNGIRRGCDIIDGYAVQGTPNAESWFFIKHGGKDVGTLILTAHAKGEHWELIYMGIVPTARGLGFGWQTLQFALWQAACHSVKRMVLAVDKSNEYALNTYRRAGFTIWDHREVLAQFRDK